MARKNWQIFITLISLAILSVPTNLVLATGTKSIGEVCQSNSECRSGDCEGSKKKDSSGAALSYCDCDDKGNSSDCATEYGAPATGSWTCSDGADYTYDLDYCYNEKTKEAKLPIEANKSAKPLGNLVDAVFDSPATKEVLLQQIKTIKPTTKILIPGVTFSDLASTTDKEGYLNIPWIGEYLVGIYNYALVIAAILAAIVIIVAGAQWTLAGGNSESISSAKKRIAGSMIGLIIAYLSYVVLITINPGLVEFKNLRIKYVEGIPLNLEFMSDSSYASITGANPLPKTEIFKKAEEMSRAANMDPCILGAILLTESGGNPGVIGHDENAGVAKSIPARRKFLLSGKKYSYFASNNTSAVFDPSPGTESSFDVKENKRKVWNDDGGKYLSTSAGPPDYGLDWRFTHGFGLGQITISGKEYCSPGIRGAKRCGKCYTIPQLLSVESSLEISLCLMKKTITAAKAAGWTNEDDVMRAAFWGYAAGSRAIPKATNGSDALYGNKSDGTRKPGDTKWKPYKECKNSTINSLNKENAVPDPEEPSETAEKNTDS